MIRLQHLCIRFGHGTPSYRTALENVSLDIHQGEFVTVIGSNGAGKSTLLNAISGEFLPNSGKIWIDTEDVTNTPPNKRAKHVSRVFQDPLAGTCASLTIAENLALAKKRGSIRGLQTAVNTITREYFAEALRPLKLGLEDRLDTPMMMLSGGQRQAISLLMATLSPLKILLLDEHTAALDPKTSKFVMELTHQIISEKKLTALMVTHSLSQALHYGSRTIMLHEGHLIYDVKGQERTALTPQDLLKQFSESIDSDKLLLGS